MEIRKITKEEVNALPLMKYEGKHQIIDEESQIEEAVNACKNSAILGFDTETKPAFRKGESYPVALLQLALPDMVYLFRLNKVNLTPEIIGLFEDPKIKIVGIGIRDDIKDLSLIHICATRLRPVLLTAITTILGLIPLAVGINIDFLKLFSVYNADFFLGGDNVAFWGPMSWTIIYGLTFATFLTLIIVPVMYLFFAKVNRRLGIS